MINRKAILVWTMGTISAGEISIAVKFTEKLSAEEYDIVYLLPKHYKAVLPVNTKSITLDPSDDKNKNRSIIENVIHDFKPDYIFLSDPYTAHFASSWTGFSFTDIKDLNIPLIGLDEYNCKGIKRKKDYYGGMIVNNRDLIEECDFVVQDVPVNSVYDSKNKNTWAYSLYSSEDIVEFDKEKLRKELYSELGIPCDTILMMLPISTWETVNMNRLPILEGLIENLIELLLFYINEAGIEEKICFLHVGKQKINPIQSEKLVYYNIDSLNSESYEKCIKSSDVFFSFNAVSVSLSKAVLNKVPSILMFNEKTLNFDKFENTIKKLPPRYGEIVSRIHIAYPFYASTFGWYNFIRPIIEEDLYFKLFSIVPVFSYSKMCNVIKDAIDKKGYFDNKNNYIDEYMESLMKLKSPCDIMDEISAINRSSK